MLCVVNNLALMDFVKNFKKRKYRCPTEVFYAEIKKKIQSKIFMLLLLQQARLKLGIALLAMLSDTPNVLLNSNHLPA